MSGRSLRCRRHTVWVGKGKEQASYFGQYTLVMPLLRQLLWTICVALHGYYLMALFTVDEYYITTIVEECRQPTMAAYHQGKVQFVRQGRTYRCPTSLTLHANHNKWNRLLVKITSIDCNNTAMVIIKQRSTKLGMLFSVHFEKFYTTSVYSYRLWLYSNKRTMLYNMFA
jgi:hypothetical protein